MTTSESAKRQMMTFTVRPYPIYRFLTTMPPPPLWTPTMNVTVDQEKDEQGNIGAVTQEAATAAAKASYQQRRKVIEAQYGPRTLTCQPDEAIQQHTLRFLQNLLEHIPHPQVILNIMDDQPEKHSLHQLLAAYRKLPYRIDRDQQEFYQQLLDRTYRLTMTALPAHLVPSPFQTRGCTQEDPYYHLVYALLIAPLALQEGSTYWAMQYVEEARQLVRSRTFPSYSATDYSGNIRSFIDQTDFTLSNLHRIFHLSFSQAPSLCNEDT